MAEKICNTYHLSPFYIGCKEAVVRLYGGGVSGCKATLQVLLKSKILATCNLQLLTTANQKQTAGHGLYDTLNDSLSYWLFRTTNVDFSVKTSAYDLRLTTTSFANNVEWALKKPHNYEKSESYNLIRLKISKKKQFFRREGSF